MALGDEVRVPPVRVSEQSVTKKLNPAPAREFPVLFEDEHLIAIDKPAGVAVHGGSGVSFGVIEQLRQARPGAKFLELVHRLDRETSGILLVAKKRSALTALQDQFRQRDTGKTYAALVIGDWPESLKVIDVALHKTLDAEGVERALDYAMVLDCERVHCMAGLRPAGRAISVTEQPAAAEQLLSESEALFGQMLDGKMSDAEIKASLPALAPEVPEAPAGPRRPRGRGPRVRGPRSTTRGTLE